MLLLLILVGLSSPSFALENYLELLFQGDRLAQEHRWEQAEQAYRKAAILNPLAAEPHVRLGRIFLKQGGVDRALVELNRAIELDPGSALAWFHKGRAEAIGKSYREAERAFRQAAEIDSEEPAPWIALGTLYLDTDQPEQALAALGRGIELAPDNAQGWYQKGVAEARLGESRRAVESFRQALAIDPSHDSVYYRLGLELMKLGGDGGRQETSRRVQTPF